MQKTNKGLIIAVVVIVVVIIIAIVAFFALSDHNPSPVTTTTSADNTTAAQSTTSAPVYTSTVDNFLAGFSTTPAVTNVTFDSPSAGPVPMTEYKAAATGSAGAYDGVFVIHYPASYAFTKDYLSGALTEFVASVNTKYPGTKLASQSSLQFEGMGAIEGVVTVPVDGVATTDYVLITAMDHNAYIISSYDTDESSFNTFLNSVSLM